MEKSFTKEDSLNIINNMILQARNNYKKGAGMYGIFWGYFIAFLSLLDFVLLHWLPTVGIASSKANLVWYLTLPVAIIYFVYIRIQNRKALVKTHIDRIVNHIWIAFCISCFMFILVLNIYIIYFKASSAALLITPVILLLLGLAQFASASVLKFKLFFYASVVFWLGSCISIISLILFQRGDIQFIILAICMLLGFCIPGHILNHKAEKYV